MEIVANYRLAVSPGGVVGLVSEISDSGDAPSSTADVPPLPRLLVTAFGHSLAAGMTELVRTGTPTSSDRLPAEFSFWRDYARQYFTALCRQYARASRAWISPDPPDPASMDDLVQRAPPMLGLEYLSRQTLQSAWHQLDQHTQAQVAAQPLGLAHYLQSLNARWNLLGRVTFHLAENNKDEQCPFAFMATFTEGQSGTGTPRHVPLARALSDSIATGDSDQLERLLEPVTAASKSCSVVARLLESRELFAPQAWNIRQAFEFLSQVPAMEEAGLIVRVPNWWNAARPPRPQVSIRLGSAQPSTLSVLEPLDLQVAVTIDGETLSPQEVEALFEGQEGLALLRGKWVQIDGDKLKSALEHWRQLQRDHRQGIDFLQGLRLLSGATFEEGKVPADAQGWSRIVAGPWLEAILETLRHPHGQRAIDPQAGIAATLRSYQVAGVEWLWFATQLKIGVCLADDMGLGKTLQIISLLVQLKRHEASSVDVDKASKSSRNRSQRSIATTGRAPSLLIVPTSLLSNWQREIARFAPDLRFFVAHRSVSTTQQLQQIARNPDEALRDYDLVATTYGLARTSKWPKQMPWRLVILDEAQTIKNAGATQTREIKAIPAEGRIALTGTPVENHLGDLWSLFDFCSPGLLGSATDFKKFTNVKDEKQQARRLASIRKLIQPYLLRRLKTDPEVAPDLPAKIELRVECGLSATQATLYSSVLTDLQKELRNSEGIQRRGVVLAALMQLKQICNHPALYLKQKQFAGQHSGKFRELQLICNTIREKQEKVLVFTQFQSMCDPLHDYLATLFGRPGLVLTGKTAAKQRGGLVAQFQEPFGPPFFVISVKAGGTGLNLTEACHVVHFDRWWNPAVENQATDRAFRIGQKRNVLVHKFVCRGTLEERIDRLIESKQQLAREILGSDGELHLTEMSNDELMGFLALDLNRIEV